MKEYLIDKNQYKRLMGSSMSYEELNELFDKVVSASVEQALRMIPGVVDYMVRHATYLNQLSTNFYEKHPELAEHKDIVTKVLEQVESENPGKPYEELLNKTVPKAKEVLSGRNKIMASREEFNLSKTDEDLGEL